MDDFRQITRYNMETVRDTGIVTRMGRTCPGKNPWKVGRALLPIKLVQLQREHESKTISKCRGISL